MKNKIVIKSAKKEWNMSDKQCQQAVNTVFNNISKSLMRGENVKVRNFGTFKITVYQERNGRNPKTGEKIIIPAKKVVRLNVSKNLKNEIQNIILEQ